MGYILPPLTGLKRTNQSAAAAPAEAISVARLAKRLVTSLLKIFSLTLEILGI